LAQWRPEQKKSPQRSGGTRRPDVDYRSFAERTPAILYRYRLRPDREIEYVNPAVTDALGYLPEDFYADPDLALRVLGEPRLPAIAEPDRPTSGAPVIRRWLRRDGTYAPIEDRTIAIRDREGRVVAVEGVARDMTAELATQQELRDSREWLDAVVSHMPVTLWATDTEGRLTFVEGTGLRSLGVTPDRLLGLTPAQVHPDAPRYRRHLILALGGRPQSVEVRLGEQRFMTWLGPLADASGTIIGVTGVSKEVTHERRLEALLASDVSERASVAGALGGLDPSIGLDALAKKIAAEVTTLDGVDHAGILAFGPGILTYLMSLEGPGLPLETGRALPPGRSVYLREHADKGPWVERWVPRAADDRYGLALETAGLRATAYVPLRRGDTVLGLLAVGSRRPNGAQLLERWMSALSEFSSLTVSLIGPALSTRQLADVIREELAEIMEQGAFSLVYQPIVRLPDRSTVAFEAFTRFFDGSQPDRRFVEAQSVGMGLRLETATLTVALDALRVMPAGAALALNVSPDMILERRVLKRLLDPIREPVILEVTEHQQIQDYEAVRRALWDLPATVGLAIDDAGAGFASLRHVIELRPEYVKLDRGLVSGVDRDYARRAVLAGMVQFARTAGCALIAEGVETEAEHEALVNLGVEYAQGFLYAWPSQFDEKPQRRTA
jgi:PAS domain S-box-containing protein